MFAFHGAGDAKPMKKALDWFVLRALPSRQRLSWVLSGDSPAERFWRLDAFLALAAKDLPAGKKKEADILAEIAEMGWLEGLKAARAKMTAAPTASSLIATALKRNSLVATRTCALLLDEEEGLLGLRQELSASFRRSEWDDAEGELLAVLCHKLRDIPSEEKTVFFLRALALGDMDRFAALLPWLDGEPLKECLAISDAALRQRSETEFLWVFENIAKISLPQDREALAQSILETACLLNSGFAIPMLLSAGADPSRKMGKKPQDAFFCAVDSGSLDALTQLCLAKPSAFGENVGVDLLLLAIKKNHGKIVAWLIGMGWIWSGEEIDPRVVAALKEKTAFGIDSWAQESLHWLSKYPGVG